MPGIIPFYGAENPEMFAIERAAMDRPGLVIKALAELFYGAGSLLDIGAGNGFTAQRLGAKDRPVIPLEPEIRMIDSAKPLHWICGQAEALPFKSNTFSGAYATWAYFFPSAFEIEIGVKEAERIVSPGGKVAIVSNLGEDEFCALSQRNIAEPVKPFRDLGFELDVIETSFDFESLEEAKALLGFYFGSEAAEKAKLSIQYRVGLFSKVVQ